MKTKIKKITPFLWFDNRAEEAVKFYISIFKSSEILRTTRYEEEGAAATGMPKGTVMTVEFRIEDQEFVALNGGPHFKFNEAISFVVNCDSQDEVDYYWGKTVRGRRPSGAAMRLAERQIRRLMAGSSYCTARAVEQPGPRNIQKGHENNASNEKNRDRTVKAGIQQTARRMIPEPPNCTFMVK